MRSTWRLRWFGAVFLPLILAALAPGVMGQTSGEKGSVQGVVINQTTGQPLRKSTLTLRPMEATPLSAATPPGYTVISDAEGKFVMDQVEPGRYTLTADHPGYLRGTYRARGSALITIGAGQTIANLRFGMIPYAVIAGRVVDEDGNPRTEVQVAALHHGRSNGRRQLVGAGPPTAVDDQGNFRIANLLPGHYTLYARVTRPVMPNPATKIAWYVITYHPNAVDISEATPIVVTAGAEVSVAIRLRKERVFRVAGKVVDAASGTPVLDRLLLVLRPQQSSPGLLTSPALPIASVREGSFEFPNVLPGSYTIEPEPMNVIIWGRESITAKFFGRYAVTVNNQNLTDLVVPFQAGVTIAGAIRTERGLEAPPHPLKSDLKRKPQPTVRLIAERPGARDFVARSNEDGTFELHHVAPERYRVYALGLPEGTYVKSVSFDRHDITNGILDLTAGAGAALAIVVSPKAADVFGVVQDDEGSNAADVLVTLTPLSAPLSPEPMLFRQARTDQNGQFRIKSLAPGEYQVLSWEDVDINLAMDPDFRAHIDRRAVTVKLQEGSRETVRLKLVPRDAAEAGEAKLR